MPLDLAARFVLPADRHYLIDRHVWAQLDDGIAMVGVAAPLREVLYATPAIEVWAVDRVDAGGPLLTAEGRGGRTVVVASPVAGSVVEMNPLLERATHTLVTQPYRHGWVARVVPECWERDVAAMESASSYRTAMDLELTVGRDSCFAHVLL
jgi:glycine cleavage system H lipoate-binding protein